MQRPTQGHDALRQRVFAGRERQSAQRRRAAVARKGGRRVIAIGAGLAVVAGVLTVTQLTSSALEDNESGFGANGCGESTAIIEQVDGNEELELHIEEEDGVQHRHYRKRNRGGNPPPASEEPGDECEPSGNGGSGDGTGDGDGDGNGGGGGTGDGDGNGDGDGDGSGDTPPATNVGTVPPGGADGNNNGLSLLGRDCSVSNLPPHTGFQSEDAQCVNTQFGEVSAVENNPTVLIVDFPDWVAVDEPFSVTISSRNLVRDRFLGAAAGGYNIESAYLDENGITRGHLHFGCMNLIDGNVAPAISTTLNPQLFTAIEDEGGGAGVSNVTVEVPGLDSAGMYRCMVWAGDGSHRVPMMSFARMQIPVDAVRITVTDGDEG